MKIIIDTSILSLALRRGRGVSAQNREIVNELNELINEARAVIAGPIRQEILSGINHLNN